MIDPIEITDLLAELVDAAQIEVNRLRAAETKKPDIARAEERVKVLTEVIGLIHLRSRATNATTPKTQEEWFTFFGDLVPPDVIANGRVVLMRLVSDLLRPQSPQDKRKDS